MRLRSHDDPPPEGGFCFFFTAGEEPETIRVEANGIRDLVKQAVVALRNNGIEVPVNLREIVEHQICLRQKDPKRWCWSGGIGDDLHHKWIAPFLGAIEEKAGGSLIGRIAGAIKGCSSCKGSTVYKSGQNNLGRAGALNKAGKIAKGIAKKLTRRI